MLRCSKASCLPKATTATPRLGRSGAPQEITKPGPKSPQAGQAAQAAEGAGQTKTAGHGHHEDGSGEDTPESVALLNQSTSSCLEPRDEFSFQRFTSSSKRWRKPWKKRAS